MPSGKRGSGIDYKGLRAWHKEHREEGSFPYGENPVYFPDPWRTDRTDKDRDRANSAAKKEDAI